MSTDTEVRYEPTIKGTKLLTLLQHEGYKDVWDLAQALKFDCVGPAICMTEGCDHVAEMETDQEEGHCESCGGQTMVSALILADLI